KNVYDIITQQIIEKLEQNIVPWRQPWTNAGIPKNPVTNRVYTGINVWILNALGYSKNLFLTFKQIQDLGGSVIKGSKSIPVVFWKQDIKVDTETGEEKKKSILRYYSVFNIEQCEGLPEDYAQNTVEHPYLIDSCESVHKNMKDAPQLMHKHPEAFYSADYDVINIPHIKQFNSSDGYYSTLFHELIHSTGHEKRLNRKEITGKIEFASYAYSKEELVAEMGACFLNSIFGLNRDFENNLAYIR